MKKNIRFWIVRGERLCDEVPAEAAIAKALALGRVKTERGVEGIARRYGCTVIWVDGYDQNGDRFPA